MFEVEKCAIVYYYSNIYLKIIIGIKNLWRSPIGRKKENGITDGC